MSETAEACVGCGRRLDADARFCAGCGAAVADSCRSCGTQLARDARFCPQCGKPAGPAAPTQEDSGELRTLTVLFADMTGSVAASSGFDPESATERVNTVLEAMVESVVEHGGTVDRFLGDGLLALFGVPEAREDDPLRAVAAATAICRRVAALGAAATAGLNTGAVYVGQVGSSQHTETTAMGPVVNLAARLQGKAAPGEVLVTAETARHAAAAFELEPRQLDIKGLTAPVEAFAVAAEKARPARRAGPATRAPVLGRAAELEQLQEAMAALGAGRGGVALIVGDPGLGKSRLIGEALRSVPQEVVVLEGRCVEWGGAAYGPFRDAIHGHFGWSPATSDDHRRLDVRSLAAGAVARAALSAAVGLEVDEPEARWDELPPLQRQRETFRALTEAFRRLADRSPAVVVLEDLHWADPQSVAVTAELFDVTRSSPLLLLCAYRPWRDHPCWGLSAEVDARAPGRAVRLSLHELGDDTCAAVAAALLGVDTVPAELRPLVVERAQGNPLFVEEFVRSAVEAGWLRRDDGQWTVAEGAGDQRVPDSLELLVRARTDRLAAPVRRVLQLAAVQGRIFSTAVLDALESPHAVQEALFELERLDIVRPERGGGEDNWAFKHVLVQETIEQGILRRTKQGLHRRLLDGLEALHGDRPAERATQLARHAEGAGDAGRAHHHLRVAGLNAKGAFQNDAAAELLGRALRWAEEAGVDPNARADLLEHRGEVLTTVGHHQEAIGCFAAAVELSTEALVRARLWRRIAGVHLVQRKYDEALRAFAAGGEELGGGRPEAPDELAEWIDLQLARASLHYWRNQPDGIAAVLAEVRGPVEAQGTVQQRAEALQLETMRALRETRYLIDERTLALARESARLSTQLADPAQRAFKRFNFGFCELWARDLDAALDDFATAIEAADRAGDVVLLSRCQIYRAVAHRFLLDERGCLTATEEAAVASAAGGMTEYLGSAAGNRAWSARRNGNASEVRAQATYAIEIWRATTLVYGFQWIARFPLLAVALDDGDRVGAEEQARFMLGRDQQRFPAPLEEPLLAGDLRRAVEVASELGYA